MRHAPVRIDPARDAAGLLRRVGFGVLGIGVPLAGLGFRRGVVILFPIGCALICAAAALDGAFRPVGTSLARLATSTAAAAIALLVGWAILGLAWAPYPAAAAERLGPVLASLAAALAAWAALPERSRVANLYLAPIGIGAAAVAGLGLGLTDGGGLVDDDGTVERGLAALAILLWPAVATLRARGRDTEAGLLVVLVGFAAGTGDGGVAAGGVAAGIVCFAAILLFPHRGSLGLGGLLAAAVMAAPLAAALLPASAGPFGAWGEFIRADPARLLTGHGIGEFLRGRLSGTVPAALGESGLVWLWHEFGAVGAGATALALFGGLAAVSRRPGPLASGIGATVGSAFAMAAWGTGPGQAWWPACLAVAGLLLCAADRGQFRTRRPRAAIFARA